jgi:hypothetical protein
MTIDSSHIITQEELSIGSELMTNAGMAAHLCKDYMQQLHDRLTSGAAIEPGRLTFSSDQMCVCHAVPR